MSWRGTMCNPNSYLITRLVQHQSIRALGGFVINQGLKVPKMGKLQVLLHLCQQTYKNRGFQDDYMP